MGYENKTMDHDSKVALLGGYDSKKRSCKELGDETQ